MDPSERPAGYARTRTHARTPLPSTLKAAQVHGVLPDPGHPRTRAFVTHGGTNGLYEAVFQAVPVVGIPLFGDQPDNLARLSRLGAATVLDFNQLTSDQLTEALNSVINQDRWG